MKSSDKKMLASGYVFSILLAAVTFITFFIAMFTPPISGIFCQEGCIEYPYTDIIDRFPRDYWWMFFALGMMAVFVVFMIYVHITSDEDKKALSLAGLSFAIMSSTLIILNYFVQLMVIQPSLVHGETGGISILTQYNPRGIFIAVEELGFLLMSISLLFLGLTTTSASKLERWIKWVLITGFLLTTTALVLILAIYGFNKDCLFEVTVITINWTLLIITGILMALLFRRSMRA